MSLTRGLLVSGILVSLCAMSNRALAHVQFDAPVEGDVLKVGSKVKLVWEDLVLHDPEGFDLDLILKPGADLTPIAHGLSIDTHSYEWQVPDQPCSECQLKVTQFNTINTDYEGFVAISISSTGGSGNIGAMAGSDAGGSASTGGESGGTTGGKSGGTTGGKSGSTTGGKSGSTTGGKSSTGGTPGSDPGPRAGTTSNAAGGSTSSSGASSDDGGCSLTHRGGPNASLSWLIGLLGLGAALVRRR